MANSSDTSAGPIAGSFVKSLAVWSSRISLLIPILPMANHFYSSAGWTLREWALPFAEEYRSFVNEVVELLNNATPVQWTPLTVEKIAVYGAFGFPILLPIIRYIAYYWIRRQYMQLLFSMYTAVAWTFILSLLALWPGGATHLSIASLLAPLFFAIIVLLFNSIGSPIVYHANRTGSIWARVITLFLVVLALTALFVGFSLTSYVFGIILIFAGFVLTQFIIMDLASASSDQAKGAVWNPVFSIRFFMRHLIQAIKMPWVKPIFILYGSVFIALALSVNWDAVLA